MKLFSFKNLGNKIAAGYKHTTAKISAFLVSNLVAVSAYANYDFDTLVDNGQSAEDVAENADNVMKIIFNIIKAAAVLVGFGFVYSGIMRIKKANEPNSQTTPVQGLLFILLGGCLGALPFIFLSSSTIVQG